MARQGVARMLTEILEASHQTAMDQIPVLVRRCATYADLHEVMIYVTDLQQRVLRPLTGHSEEAGTATAADLAELQIGGTLAGRAFQEVRMLTGSGSGSSERWWIPILDGTERLGVLRVDARGTGEDVRDAMRALVSVVALLILSKREHSDTYARLVRTRPMKVDAEMQWHLTPPITFAGKGVVINGALEPAYEVGGDAFDYAISGDVVHLAVFDAMGHDIRAGLTANLALASGRNHRRQGAGLVETGDGIERLLVEEFSDDVRFVTAILAELDTSTGHFSWISRGHHAPVLIRGGRWVTGLGCPPAPPVGLDLGLDPPTVCTEHLEPGDRVLLYTDGITEARDGSGRQFGLDRFVDFVIRSHADGLSVPETLRRLIHSVLDHHGDRLQDDATVLLVEWRGDAHQQLKV
ncbi:PP2C family protein-serine/threonine phosphatase [Thermomonospora umbrina]|uniref:Serine phosphatase RsbU (Regulator of sigma subunit) n=1 Tax=Thermomonospora umbrina TaxID=111806 RepID=A0A3D9T5F3_9ACTN|nr:PP2C family protein-serine/threonine phosphatase [Thermomonospora umbrina]REF00476.1 serine phosphatase RsbU (regulator of sigma subunit) [Thermomonospora umbrina]